MKPLNGTRHAVAALAAFATITLTMLWLSGTFTARRAEAAATKAWADGPDAHGHGGDHAHDHAGVGHEGHAHAEAGVEVGLTPEQIEVRRCEHDIRQVDCDECRYELGVVKLAPSVAQALTRTARVQQAEAVTRLQLTGEVQFDQTAMVDVVPPASGRVVTVQARLGRRVEQGDVLAIIRSSEFGEAKAAYLEALASAQIANRENQRQAAIAAALEKMLASLENNPAVATASRDEPLGEWRSRLIGAAARLQQARSVAGREQALLDKQASSQAEYETAQRELQTAQADYAALVEEVHLSLSLDRLKAGNAAALAEAKLNAADQRLHVFGLDDAAMQAMARAGGDCRFAELEIRAPRAGTITSVNITEGKGVEAGQSLFTVVDLSNLWVWCNLYERDLAALHAAVAQRAVPAAVRVPAFDRTFEGVLDLVGHLVDESTRTIKARVQLPNEGGLLRPGMFAAVEVDLPGGQPVLLVPGSAVMSDEGRSFVFQHWKEDLWLRRDVRVGKSRADAVEVLAGLDPDAVVVASGAFLLKSDVLKAKMGAGCAD